MLGPSYGNNAGLRYMHATVGGSTAAVVRGAARARLRVWTPARLDDISRPSQAGIASLLPYWILFLVFAAGAIQFRPRPDAPHRSHLLLGLCMVGVALMIGLRFQVGGDWGSYLRIFNAIGYFGLHGTRADDPGYGLLNLIMYRLGLGIWAVNLACALIFCWGLYSFAIQQPNPWLSVLIAVPYLIIVVGMGYTRQAVAIGIIMAGLAHVGRRSLANFTIYDAFAALFHKSAVIVLPLVAISATTNRIVSYAILSAGSVLLYMLLLRSSVDALMSNYVTAQYSSSGAAIRIAMNLPPAILFLLYRARFGLPRQEERLWTYVAWASLVAPLFLIFTSSSTAVDRIALYLIPIQLYVLNRVPDILALDSRGRAELTLAVIGYSAAIQFTWLNFAANVGYWVPYRFYFG